MTSLPSIDLDTFSTKQLTELIQQLRKSGRKGPRVNA
jgi:hypothetical protein